MRQTSPSLRRIVATSVFVLAFCWPLAAATVSKLNDDVLAPLRGPVVAKRIHINNMPLYAHGSIGIDLEEFQVWAPGGKVIVHDGKSVQYLDPPPMRFFRGLVNGDPESFAYFSVDERTGAISGLMETREGKFAVDSARRRSDARSHTGGVRNDQVGDFDFFLTSADAGDEMPMTGETWSCGVERVPAIPHVDRKILADSNGTSHSVIAQGISGTQSYAIALEVETDTELYDNSGHNSTVLMSYVTNLTGALSTVYNRDLHTNVVLQNANVYASGSDPWTATDAVNGLYELGDYYRANHSNLKRSAVVMMSGKNIQFPDFSGFAWEGTIGLGDQLQGNGHYAGAYAWFADVGLGGLGSIPDPNATTNGSQYGMPNGSQNFYPLQAYAHELGHNLAGHHTHCVAITQGEANGTNHSTQLFVDVCDTVENGCATGSASAPPEKGTLMSYCHIIFVGQAPQSRYTFGQASEVSHHELDDYMLNPAGPLMPPGGPFNIVTAVGTFTMSTITASSTVQANSTGNTASVTSSNGGTPTYSWTITNGSIPGSSTGSSILYTAGASGNVVLRATAYKNGTNGSGFANGGVGVTDTKTVTIVTCTGAGITTQPASTSIVTGQTATLSVTASGTATLSYQWYTGTSPNTASPIGGATSPSINVSPGSTTSYWVRVTNSCGTANSTTATVTVTTNPPSVATLFYLVTPCRIIDTRNANGPQGGPALVSGGTRTITVNGVCGIPAGVVAISINVAVVAPSAGGYLTLFTGPAGATLPLASTINYQTNRTLANNAIVKAGSDAINIFNGGPTVNYVIDVNGYFK